jgi:hypothetical protein
MKVMKTAVQILVGLSLMIGSSASIFAATDSETQASSNTPLQDSMARDPAADKSESTKRRSYPGGIDEQEIKVQTSLPQPTRTLDGQPLPNEEAPPPAAAGAD